MRAGEHLSKKMREYDSICWTPFDTLLLLVFRFALL